MSTFFPKEGDLKKKWYVADANEAVLGRLSAKVAAVLRGKHKAVYTPHADTGDYVVVINAGKVRLTGNKLQQKTYARYSGYPGGLKSVNAKTLLAKKPEEVIRLSVKGMLPKNALGRRMLKKLKVYGGSEHPHKAQMPEVLDVRESSRG
ncbi:MAG: 50S ribosomal protein L13 [Syntrophorhabdales bacterium]|jgi:large subunit ribosomal protein L13